MGISYTGGAGETKVKPLNPAPEISYEFCLNHVVEVEEPLELFSFQYETL